MNKSELYKQSAKRIAGRKGVLNTASCLNIARESLDALRNDRASSIPIYSVPMPNPMHEGDACAIDREAGFGCFVSMKNETAEIYAINLT